MVYRSPLVDTDLSAYLAYLYNCAVDNGGGENYMSIFGRGIDNGIFRGNACFGVGGCRRLCFGGVVADSNAVSVSCCVGECGDFVSERRCIGASSEQVEDKASNEQSGKPVSIADTVGSVGGLSEDVRSRVGVLVDGGVSVVSSRTLRNREKRIKKKDRKLRKQLQQRVGGDVPEWRRDVVMGASVGVSDNCGGKGLLTKKYGYFSELSDDSRKALRESRAARLEAENKLQQAKAERALELLRASDVEKVKKMNETRVMRNTELNKVQVEQAFTRLSATGNVPGFAETVVSGTPTLSSGSISPNSSVSAAEVHAMQKELLELQLQSKELNRLKESVRKYIPESVYENLVRESAETVDTSFTADTMGHELANGGGYHYCDDGRYRPGERFDNW